MPQRKWKGPPSRPGRPLLVHQVSRSRWKVDWSHAWLDNSQRVHHVRRYTESYMAFLTIACFLPVLSSILD